MIRGLAESKLNTIADRISVALSDDKITEEEFRLIFSEVDKYNQMKTEIRGRQKQSLSEDEKSKSGVLGSKRGLATYFVSPSDFSRRAVVSYWRKYVQEVLVSRLGGLSLPRKKCG